MLAKSLLFAAAIPAIGLGWLQMLRFSSTPGEQSAAPRLLPDSLISRIAPDAPFPALPANRPLLLVFVHPLCACTHATLQELNAFLDANRAPIQLVLAVYGSEQLRRKTAATPFSPAAWLHHPYRILPDPGGQLAQRFGAATSGEILLYSPNGQLLFQGGITPERAQVGPSAGADALRNALDSIAAGAHLLPRQSAVFGCPIFHPAHTGKTG